MNESSSTASASSSLGRLVWLLLAACAGLIFLPLGHHALWDSDEGRYAEIAREMLAGRDWIVPHLNGLLYFEKPPLAYWVTAVSQALFGHNAFGARAGSAFLGFLTLVLVYRIGARWRGERTGLLAVTVLATSLGFFALTQYLTVDMTLTFWLTLAMSACVDGLRLGPRDSFRKPLLTLAVACAGGFLTKGLIALLIPLTVLVLTVAWHRLSRDRREFPVLPAVGLFLLLALPWMVLITVQHPSWPHFFFVREHFARYFTPVHQRGGPIYYFLPVVLGGFLPWAVFLPKMMSRGWAHRRLGPLRDPAGTFLWVWALFIWAFFSLSSSKLPAYMLPLFPALALLLAELFDDVFDAPEMPAWLSWGLGVLILLHFGLLVLLKWSPAPDFLKDPIVVAVLEKSNLFMIDGALIVLILVGVWGMRAARSAIAGIVVSSALFLGGLVSLTPALDPWLSTASLASTLIMRAQPQDRMAVYGVSFENYAQTLPFYLQQRVAVWGPVGELAMGAELASDRALWLADEGDPAFQALRQSPVGTWVVTNQEHWNDLAVRGIQSRFALIEKSGRLRLLQKTE